MIDSRAARDAATPPGEGCNRSRVFVGGGCDMSLVEAVEAGRGVSTANTMMLDVCPVGDGQLDGGEENSNARVSCGSCQQTQPEFK